ncbi:uncharacterized protein MKZ38_006981 [Zalerion maritima]|uniref:Nineteen complex-related protein 2-domain-containing protein n=1 Tax=Zalerion maritima TaxID=339359 RepID=A0AAD5RIK0_9PEZI|nr:uncharacterized protein MKZ38_006981 [Zalerion maritima]
MSAFGAKRKARKIVVDDLDDLDDLEQNTSTAQSAGANIGLDPSSTTRIPKFAKRPHKHSSLRKSINLAETSKDDASKLDNRDQSKNDDEDDGPVVIKPSSISRSSSLRGKKKKPTGSRLSFGPSGEDAADADGEAVVSTPKKKGLGLSQKAMVNSARNLPLPVRNAAFGGGGDTRTGGPSYSKEYLAELQSTTPNTPVRTPKSSRLGQGDVSEMELDEAELDGAVVVEETTSTAFSSLAVSKVAEEEEEEEEEEEGTRILTQVEIEERKARRHNRALQGSDESDESDEDRGGRGVEKEFISLIEDDDDDFHLHRMRNKGLMSEEHDKDTRLVREDEDLGEGFDDFVEDGGLALGKKAEREARRQQRKEMAEMINEAEVEDESEDDSEAERIIAFENAQTRAGMEGLSKKLGNEEGGKGKGKNYLGQADGAGIPAPAKITPIPEIGECLARFRATLGKMRKEVETREKRLEQWRREQDDIEHRERELQEKLREAGERYGKLLGETGGGAGLVVGAGGGGGTPTIKGAGAGRRTMEDEGMMEGMEASPLRSLPASMGLLPEQRGLESFGNTPVRRPGLGLGLGAAVDAGEDEDDDGYDDDEEMGGM